MNFHENARRRFMRRGAGIGAAAVMGLASRAATAAMDASRKPEGVATCVLADKVKVFLAFPPQPQEIRVQKAGHVLLDTTFDKPWSQYFCCLVTGHRDFVRKYPVAAKRALRAVLKAADICAEQPEYVARFLQQKGIESRYDVSLDVLTRLPYHHWRDWNVEDTMRFHALRLKDVGMIQSAPNDLIARCTDQRFLSELKREMKA